MGFN
ncbi:hypothetical protein AZE42_11222, partial [Rhizopogon vesiculosus]|jgi:hypothetical protein